MQTLILCEVSIKAPFQLRGLGKPSVSPFLTYSIPRRNWSHFHRISPRSKIESSRYVNGVVDGLLTHFGRTPRLDKDGMENRILEDSSRNTTLDSSEIDCVFNNVDGVHEDTGLMDGSHSSSCQDGFSLSDIYNGIKFAALCGLLAFQGSPYAVAEMEFTGGIQAMSYLGDLGDLSTGFASAFLLIFFSELGDKTFFIAALLAARNSGAVIFVGTFGALGAMTIISVIIGRTFHYVDDILPFRLGETDLPIDDIAAACLLIYFGVSTLLDAASDDDLKMKEEQKKAELAISELRGNGAGILAAASTIISTFVLVFVAEWGDKSFFSTIALAAASSPLGVVGGALAGHAVATLIAVVGGSFLGTFLSEKVIAYVGGTLFLVFALATMIEVVS
ncbi:Gdt1 family protein [Dioscorea alata]|uniref:Gdt1 family protein n=1 Tax=Dioscorea alata TaxID=55571 RepID=A0ACB7TUU7_DIOAL|nr:Gdt1 family protein [Dioscorea alata]